MRPDPAPGVDVRSAMALFAAAIAACFLLRSPAAHLALATVTTAAATRCRPRALARLLGPILPLLGLIFLFAALAPPPGVDPRVAVAVWPGGPAIATGGLRHGAVLVLRIVTMVAATTVLLRHTRIEQITALLQAVRMPHALVFLIVTALRFLPTLRQRVTQIQNAQRLRGVRLDEGGPLTRLKANATVMIPLLTCGIRMSEQVSAAMVVRGYGMTKHPTPVVELTWSWRDHLVSGGAVALVAAAIAL